MRLTRRAAALLAISAALAAAWSSIRDDERDVTVLRTFDVAGKDSFTTLWFVEDASGFVWIRANRPDRRWLAQLREQPSVTLGRGGRSQSYEALIFDDAKTRRYVAPWFREKYGLPDLWREWTTDADTVPVRLQVH